MTLECSAALVDSDIFCFELVNTTERNSTAAIASVYLSQGVFPHPIDIRDYALFSPVRSDPPLSTAPSLFSAGKR